MSRAAVLFVCQTNTAGSQLAAALLRSRLGDSVEILSAGIAPGEQIDPAVIEVLAESGVTLGPQRPVPLDVTVLQRADLTVVVGEEATLPLVTGMSGPIETWPYGPVTGPGVEGLRAARDDLDQQIAALADDLRRVLHLPDGREAGHLPPPGQPPVCID